MLMCRCYSIIARWQLLCQWEPDIWGHWLIEAWWRIYVSVKKVIVIIDSGDGLSPKGTTPLPEPILTYCQLDTQKKNFSEILIKIQLFS